MRIIFQENIHLCNWWLFRLDAYIVAGLGQFRTPSVSVFLKTCTGSGTININTDLGVMWDKGLFPWKTQISLIFVVGQQLQVSVVDSVRPPHLSGWHLEYLICFHRDVMSHQIIYTDAYRLCKKSVKIQAHVVSPNLPVPLHQPLLRILVPPQLDRHGTMYCHYRKYISSQLTN